MDFDRDARMGLWSALEIRQMLRRLGGDSWDRPALMAAFGMTRVEVDVLLRTLFGAGYLVVDPARSRVLCWIRTPAGKAFAEVPLGRPLSRARADRLLQSVLRRVAEINRKPYYRCRIAAVGVFGSYLTAAPVLDELDLAIRLVRKAVVPGPSPRRWPYWQMERLLPPREWAEWQERHVELSLGAGLWHVVLHRCDHPLLQGQRIRLVFLE
jgi:hypothetical protein